MPYSVYQHWDPLKTCVVGRSYPPEFYQWIKVSHVRNLFEKIAQETEEDFQNIIKKLQSFGVEILRPDIDQFDTAFVNDKFKPPPMTPRDSMIMIGETFYHPGFDWRTFYEDIKDPSWPCYDTYHDFLSMAEPWQIEEVKNVHGSDKFMHESWDPRYQTIVEQIRSKGNFLHTNIGGIINGAMVSRIGRDLYFATETYDQDQDALLERINKEFVTTRNHVVNTGGHGDGTYCPVAPGLIISLLDVPTYAETFPDWEVVYLPNQSWQQVKPFLALKSKNRGRWWIPGFEHDQAVINVVESWLGHWVGYVEETVFDVNMLIIDPKNVMVFNENDQVFRALDRYGITPHVVPFRHRYFWDGGIHCVTLDLDRDGEMKDFFPDRKG
jgi:glycine amidinotransferase